MSFDNEIDTIRRLAGVLSEKTGQEREYVGKMHSMFQRVHQAALEGYRTTRDEESRRHFEEILSAIGIKER